MEMNGKRIINGSIPIWEDKKGREYIRVGKATYVTVKPVQSDVRSMGDARRTAEAFSNENGCQATITYDSEWMELCQYLQTNFATREFIEMNSLDKFEVLLLDSLTSGDKHILAAGRTHRLNELFTGFISGEDSDGEPQPQKELFLTIRVNIP